MTQPTSTVYETNFPGLVNRGKVRDLYSLTDQTMMIVAADRISAFDVVMKEAIPGKGAILTRMSRFWLETLPACSPHHMEYVVEEGQVPDSLAEHAEELVGRAMVVKRLAIIPIECIVRGYIIGSGWKEYQAVGSVSQVELPAGLKKAERLAEPIFTPSTKADVGHDELVGFEEAVSIVERHIAPFPCAMMNPRKLLEEMRDRSLEIYRQAAAHAEERGIILADTKFEFGLFAGQLMLADEVLTPDSSRFWPRESYRVGEDPPSFDKQFLRDYLESAGWGKEPPPPQLPAEIVEKTRARYEEAYRLLTQ